MTYYAVFFRDDWYCSLFYEVSVYSQERDENALIETTTEGLRDALKENAVPPLSRAEVEERARKNENDGLLPKGWYVVPIEV